jgi:hypothetical protein
MPRKNDRPGSAVEYVPKASKIVTVPLPSLSAPGAAIIDSKNRSNEKTGDIEIGSKETRPAAIPVQCTRANQVFSAVLCFCNSRCQKRKKKIGKQILGIRNDYIKRKRTT